MNAVYGIGELDETDEAFDEAFDESDEAYDEAAPRRGVLPPPVRTAPRQSAFRPRPNNNFVTQAQLQAALARVSSQIATNSTALKTLDGRLRGVTSEQARMTMALRKEIADRKKDAEVMRKEIQSAKELAVILPLIAKDNPLIGVLALGGGSLFGGSPSTNGAAPAAGDSTSNILLLALAFGGLTPKKP
jgi:hypothetical protein